MILVADDDSMVRKTIVRTLTHGGYETAEFEDGVQVLEALETIHPDLILMDVRMPKLDGIKTCRRIRAIESIRDIPIILVSGLADAETIVEGLDHGADDYVVKPFQPVVLLAKVRATLRAKREHRAHGEIVNLAAGTEFDGRFEIRSKLGHGGMGVVYRASDLRTDDTVVLKIQDCRDEQKSKSSQRFRREVEALAEINHPNVVRILSAGLCEGHHYYAMDFVDGRSLRDHMEDRGALAPPEALRIAGEIADGLCAVHGAGFVHRDVKPENILIGSNGKARIGDFGVAFPVELEMTRLTQDGTIIGTPLYMAPEQVDGETDQRSDVFSLGIVLFEMLTGTFYRKIETSVPALIAELHRKPRLPSSIVSSIPGTVDDICMKAYHPAPAERFQSATDFAVAVRGAGATS